MRALTIALLLATVPAFAQGGELTPPPLPIPESPTYLERCFAVPAQVWVPTGGGRYSLVPAASTPLPSSPPPQSNGGSGGTGGGGSLNIGDGKALLVLAVVVLAVLPVIVYAVDDDAPLVVEQRFHCPTFGFDLMGGVDLGERVGTRGSGSGRFTFGAGYFGSDFQFDLSAGSINSWAGHLMVRIAPKNHLEPSIAVGFRSMTLGRTTRMGVELGVPHRYVLWREGLRQFSLEIRPTFLVGPSGWDVGVEAGLVIPIVEPLHLRAGGKVQSFGNDLIGGFNAGLSFVL